MANHNLSFQVCGERRFRDSWMVPSREWLFVLFFSMRSPLLPFSFLIHWLTIIHIWWKMTVGSKEDRRKETIHLQCKRWRWRERTSVRKGEREREDTDGTWTLNEGWLISPWEVAQEKEWLFASIQLYLNCCSLWRFKWDDHHVSPSLCVAHRKGRREGAEDTKCEWERVPNEEQSILH